LISASSCAILGGARGGRWTGQNKIATQQKASNNKSITSRNQKKYRGSASVGEGAFSGNKESFRENYSSGERGGKINLNQIATESKDEKKPRKNPSPNRKR